MSPNVAREVTTVQVTIPLNPTSGRKRATITVRLARLTREKHVVLPGALATVITVSNGEEGKLHKQNIFYDILLIIVIREYILGINCFHATIFI